MLIDQEHGPTGPEATRGAGTANCAAVVSLAVMRPLCETALTRRGHQVLLIGHHGESAAEQGLR